MHVMYVYGISCSRNNWRIVNRKKPATFGVDATNKHHYTITNIEFIEENKKKKTFSDVRYERVKLAHKQHRRKIAEFE